MHARTYRSTLALAVSCGLLGVSFASRAETLEEVLYKAAQSNPQIRAEQAVVRATDELAPQALANWRPTVTANATSGWDRVLYDNTQANSDLRTQTRQPKTVSLTINEYLYRGGRTIAATSVAENKILAERARLMVTESGVLTDVASAYMRVLMQRDLVALTTESEKGIADELAGTRRRFDMGERTKTDISQAETRHAKAVADRVSAESDLAVAESNYRGLLGQDPGQMSLPAFPDALPAKRETAVNLALDSNYGIAAAIYDEKAALNSIKLASGELLPTVAVQGTVGRDIETSTANSRIDDATVKLTLSVPIYDGGLAYSKTRQARQTHSQSSINLEKAKRDAVQAATQAWDTMALAKERIRVNEARVAAADTALNNISREQSFGTKSLVDVLDARQELVDARTALVRARNDYYVAGFQLKQAIGEMTSVKLGLGEPNYSPKPHYEDVHDKWFGGRSSIDKERGNTVPVPADPPPRDQAPLPSDIKAAAPQSVAPIGAQPPSEAAPPAETAPQADVAPAGTPSPDTPAPKEAPPAAPAAEPAPAPAEPKPLTATPLPASPAPSDIDMSPFAAPEAQPETAPAPQPAPSPETSAPKAAPEKPSAPPPAQPEAAPKPEEMPSSTKTEASPPAKSAVGETPAKAPAKLPATVMLRSTSPLLARLDAE